MMVFELLSTAVQHKIVTACGKLSLHIGDTSGERPDDSRRRSHRRWPMTTAMSWLAIMHHCRGNL